MKMLKYARAFVVLTVVLFCATSGLAATQSCVSSPVITSNPADRTTFVGANVTLTATASGNPTPDVRWQLSTDGLHFNGIVGASGTSLLLPRVQMAMNGYKYRAVFFNNCGIVYSDIATLTVSPAATKMTIAALTDTTTYGQSASFSANVLNGIIPVTEGTVTFMDGAQALGSAPLNSSGYAVFSTSSPGAGTHQITAVYNGTDSYLPSTTGAPAVLTVTPATLTVTFNEASKLYGAALPGFTVRYSGFVNGDTASAVSGVPGFVTTASASSPTGVYPVTLTAGTLAATSYNFNFVGGSLTVTKALLTVKADNQTRAYGATNPTLTYSVSGFANGDTASVISGTPALATTATTSSPAGTYPISVSISGLSAANYSFTTSNGTLTVTKAMLTVKADNQTRTYGTANPTLTYSVSGFVNGDTASIVSGTPALTTTATPGSPAGTYPISVDLSRLSATNYSLTTGNGTLTVTKALLTVKADNQTRAYGAANPTLTYSVSGFVNGDTASVISGTPALATTATTSSPAGTYPISIDVSRLSATNYSFTTSNGTLTVTKAMLTVKADNQTRTYGAANPTFTYSVSGFVNGDTASVIGGAPALSTSATTSSAVGTYAITASVGSLTATSYSFTTSNGTLTINKAALSVKADDKSKVFGASLPAFTVTYAGFVNGETAAVLSGTLNVSTTATANSPAGVYPITVGGLSATNYNVSFASGALTVTAAGSRPVLTANNNPALWGQAVTLTATLGKATPDAAVPTGTVTFTSGSTAIGTGSLNGSGQATLTLSNFAVGAHQLTAEYGGDNNYSAAASAALTLTVNKATTTTTLVSSASPVTINQPVTFTATVSSAAGTPSGIVEFFDGEVSLGAAPLSNGAAFVTTSTLIAGDHSIRAAYNGDATFAGSSSAALAQTVNPACTWTLSTTSILAEVGSGAYSVNLIARSDCAWTAVSNAPWITISSGQSGSGDGAVSLTVEPLGNLASRTGTLTLAGQTVTVTQSRSFTAVSAAGYEGGVIANEQMMAGFGPGISPVTVAATSLPLTDTLGDVKVRIKDSAGVEHLAKLLFVSPNQINFVAPVGMADGSALLTVLNGELEIASGAINVTNAAPGLFAANSTGRGVAAALALRVRADGTQSYEPVAQFDTAQNQFVAVPIDLGADQNAAADEVFLVLFCTGVRNRTSQNNVSVKLGDIDAEVLYAGAQPSFAGLDQINVRLPRTLIGRGEVNVTVTVDGKAANPVTVRFK